jgi:hypothetical protein
VPQPKTSAPRRSAPKTALPPPRVRREPPTVEEAVAAAQDLSDDIDHQVTIAAGLIGLPEEEVRPFVLKAPRDRTERVFVERPSERQPERTMRSTTPLRGPRTVIVERRPALGNFSSRIGGRR